MGIFEKAGETFEQTKQSVLGGSDAEYVCWACEQPVEKDYEHCPHCGEVAVEPVE